MDLVIESKHQSIRTTDGNSVFIDKIKCDNSISIDFEYSLLRISCCGNGEMINILCVSPDGSETVFAIHKKSLQK